ncbi:MAG: hypothetical protein Q9173_000430 [Seirophora scorigena]
MSNMPKALATKDDNARPKLSKATAEAQQRYSDYRDIPLEEVLGEIPYCDDATTVRPKLKKLLTHKIKIPESRDGAVEYHKKSTGQSVRSLGTFWKKTGKKGGGNSPAYYWGYVLCEKLRIWKGVKKTKSREEAEQINIDGGSILPHIKSNVLCPEMDARQRQDERTKAGRPDLRKKLPRWVTCLTVCAVRMLMLDDSCAPSYAHIINKKKSSLDSICFNLSVPSATLCKLDGNEGQAHYRGSTDLFIRAVTPSRGLQE